MLNRRVTGTAATQQVGKTSNRHWIVATLSQQASPNITRFGLPLSFRPLPVVEDQLAPTHDVIWIVWLQLGQLLHLRGRLVVSVVGHKSFHQSHARPGVRWSFLDGITEPLFCFRHASLNRQHTGGPHHGVDVFGMVFHPLRVVADEAIDVATRPKHFFDAAANIAVQPAIWVDNRQLFFEVG